MIKTIEEAYAFVLQQKVCTIFGSKGSPYESLWDNVDLSDKKPAGGWSERVSAIWKWKNELPAIYSDEIFYGKVPPGDAVLMDMNFLRDEHYKSAKRPVSSLNEFAQCAYEYVRVEPRYTGELRKLVMADCGCTKSRFDTALKHLQISLNIVRTNDLNEERDLWLPFSELYPDIVAHHEG